MSMRLLHARPDGTFVIELHGMPYHVVREDPLHPIAEAAARRVVLDPEPEPPAPPERIPTITRRQLRRWLLRAGVTAAMVEAQIARIPDETEREEALIDWQDATVFERDNPMVKRIGEALGMTSEQIDEAFYAAALI